MTVTELRQFTLAQRVVAEGVGTALLLAAVVGSGIMGERLAGGNVAIALLANTIATGAALVALTLTFGAISGARRYRDQRQPDDIDKRGGAKHRHRERERQRRAHPHQQRRQPQHHRLQGRRDAPNRKKHAQTDTDHQLVAEHKKPEYFRQAQQQECEHREGRR